jgi:putative membrane protein
LKGEALNRLLISWFINAVALAMAAWLVRGITVVSEPQWLTVAIMALIFGLVNALIRPLLKLLTCPLIILTLGLFTLVINAVMLWLASWIGTQFDLGFEVTSFWPTAVLGALVISVVSFILSLVLKDDDSRRRRRKERQRDRW